MKVPFLDLTPYHQTIKSRIIASLEDCYDINAFCLGPKVEGFEKQLAAYAQLPHAIGVNSGTSALHLALLAAGVRPNDEVIVPAMTFISTAWGVSYCGAKPVFADVDLKTRNISTDSVESLISEKTKAVIAVHLYGHPAEMDRLRELCNQHNLSLIEDSAQALGASYKGKAVGHWGDITCLSFYPGKNLGATGEGGAILTASEEIAKLVRSLRNHGTTTDRYRHEHVGYNYRMDGFQASTLSIKLEDYDARNQSRKQLAKQYREKLGASERIILPSETEGVDSVWHLYVVLLEKRDLIAEKLKEKGIGSGLHYPTPLHLQPCYQSLGQTQGSCPNAEHIADHCLSLPMFPELTEEQIEYVCEMLISTVNDSA